MTPFERWSVLATSGATALTGVIYLWMKYALAPADALSAVNHPLQPLVLKLHILVAPLLVFALGLITIRHVWRHFRQGVPAGRKSGLTTAVVTAPMVVSGYVIQAVTAPGWLRAVAWLHIVTGVVFTIGLILHWWLVIRTAGQRPTVGAPSRGTPRRPAPDPAPEAPAPSVRSPFLRTTQ